MTTKHTRLHAFDKNDALGLHDAFRLHSDVAGEFSWWDYRQAAFRRNLGLRIDLTLVSDALRARCVAGHAARQALQDRFAGGATTLSLMIKLSNLSASESMPTVEEQ